MDYIHRSAAGPAMPSTWCRNHLGCWFPARAPRRCVRPHHPRL